MAAGRKTGGRRKGTPNRATASLRDIAQQYTVESVEALVNVLRREDAPAIAVVAAANALLDRGHGKPKQELDVHGKVTLEQLVTESLKARDGDDGGGGGAAPVA